MVQFECPMVIHPLVPFTFGFTGGCPFSLHARKLHVACQKSGNSYCKNRFRGLHMVQFECPRVINPLVLFTFGVQCGVPISLYAGKGKCCMWLVNEVEIHFAKISCEDSKWSNLNAPRSYTPLGLIHFWGLLMWGAISTTCRKREMMQK